MSDGAIDGIAQADMFGTMKGKFTAIIEEAPGGGYWAVCPEVPGANGQGETVAETKKNLRDAIRLIFVDRVADARE
ncbi:MAG: type II toxin-antitoxin system HicB family antitoxin [Candidatus Didemnitutus sp.]|nr:type II toxin-antitoxin system HicB family antitoxin [Candidatus Didemnitutus sp.]